MYWDLKLYIMTITMFKFCPKCGGSLAKKTKTLFVCTQCEFHFYQNPKPSNALIIINTNSDVLLVKRKFEPKKGFWDLPGGFIEINETLEESTIREIKEELGVKIENIKYFKSYADTYSYKGVNFPTICAVFYTITKNNILPKIKIGDDILEAKLFKSKAIPFDKIAFKTMRMALRDFLSSYVNKATKNDKN